MKKLESKVLSNKNDTSILLFYCNSQYLYIAQLLDSKMEDAAKIEIIKFDNYLKLLYEKKISKLNYYTLSSSKFAYMVASGLSNSISSGYKIIETANNAYEIDANSPYSLTQKGFVKFYFPGIFGGDFEEANFFFKKAIVTFEENSKPLACNWYYLNTLLFLAKSYEELNKKSEAIKVYEKMLLLAPEYHKIAHWKKQLIEGA
ncbi:MAG: hypothetical protein IPO21_20620 [Bacteroidales bacterium]|nr:hypothetical protein [Bacteroidales bacterium]